MNYLSSFAIVLFFFSCNTSNSSKMGNVQNSDYMSFLLEECEQPDILDVERAEDENYIEIEYFCNGKTYEMGIKNNTLMFVETGVKLTEIPIEKIRKKLNKNYKNWSIDEASEVRTADTSFYKLEIIKDGVELNLYFTKDAKWFKFNSLQISDKWNLDIHKLSKSYAHSGYNFFEPNKIYEMPDLLREISGITLKNQESMYCVQDELGAIFEYHLIEENLEQIHRFTDIGDFEDLAVLEDKIYILRSDGLLFPYLINEKQTLETTMLALNTLDLEGLCVWKNNIYVASKAAQINQADHKRSIFKLEENKLHKPELYLEIDIDKIKAFASKNYEKLDVSSLQFNPSAIAFHPKTEALYVLSASDRLLLVFKDKKIENVILLPSNVYYKPEGLAFSANGDLYISSEGDKKGFVKGSIMFFKYDF